MNTERVAKSVIKLVILTACEIAHAQGSVALYGIVDTGLYYQTRTPNGSGSVIQMMDGGLNSSVYGLTGKEDLGGGYSVKFKLEGGFETTNGAIGNSNGGLFGREANVSLDGPYGTVRMGLQYSPFAFAAYWTDPQGYPNGASQEVLIINYFNGASIFTSNAVSYTTPEIAGVSGIAMFSLGGVAGNFGAGKESSFNIKYDRHGLLLALAYFNAHNNDGALAYQGKLLGGAYTWGNLRVAGAFVNYREPTAPLIRNINVYSGGAMYNVTPSIRLSGAVFESQDEDHHANRSTLLGFGGQYLLSVRTLLYTQVDIVNNKGKMQTGLNAQATDALSGLPAGTTTGINIGINHTF